MSTLDEIDDTNAERDNLLSQVAIAAIRQITTEAIAAIRDHATPVGYARIKMNAPRNERYEG